MGLTRGLVAAGLLLWSPVLLWGEVSGARPLIAIAKHELGRVVPSDATLLDEPKAIEGFLAGLDGQPPDWASIFNEPGTGHDERLFALNRERDVQRAGRPGLAQRVTFLWEGQLSDYEAAVGGYRVAIGPKVIPTAWGLVRFKPEGLPSNLVAGPPLALREFLRKTMSAGRKITIAVAMTGRLAPEESLIYDRAHDEPGRGVVMPVVQVERLDYLYFQD